MALQITLVKTPATAAVSKTSHTFNQQGGTFGRNESNIWALPDPDKFLSSCHCEILFEGGRYLLLDLSTNGTFLNSAFEPLGKGSKSPLKDGDFFEIGDYRFNIRMIDDQPFGANPVVSSNQPAAATPFTDIFGSAPFADPFSEPAGKGFLPADYSIHPDSQSVDPLVAMDRAGKVAGIDPFGGGRAAFNTPYHSPPPSQSEPDIFAGMGQLDHSPSLDQAIAWPSAAQENVIPEDWEDDIFGGSPKADPFSSALARPVQPSSAPANPFAQTPVSPAVRAPVVPRSGAPVLTPVAEPIPAIVAPPEFVAPTPSTPQRDLPPVNATVAPPPVVSQHASLSPAGARLVESMGLDPKNLSAEQIEGISDSVGELMREIVEGMMQVLRSRTSIKNEFRMNVTTIQPVENNPLKFSVGVDEALENMFIKKTNAYKKPVDAFREGFQEIGEHQLAMIAGIRFGFERMMDRFNPENLEKQFLKQGKGGGVIPGMQKAKYWNNYREHYESFSDNMESSFQHLFGSDFVNAYEDQLRKLAAVRKKNK